MSKLLKGEDLINKILEDLVHDWYMSAHEEPNFLHATRRSLQPLADRLTQLEKVLEDAYEIFDNEYDGAPDSPNRGWGSVMERMKALLG
jgi:hypothetical protein